MQTKSDSDVLTRLAKSFAGVTAGQVYENIHTKRRVRILGIDMLPSEGREVVVYVSVRKPIEQRERMILSFRFDDKSGIASPCLYTYYE